MNAYSDVYPALTGLFAKTGAAISVAELHGGLCGALCIGGIEAADSWLRDCLMASDRDREAAEELAGVLEQLRLEAWKALAGTDMSFEPLLPGDDEPLSRRVDELAHWCHGFIGGLGTAGLNLSGKDSDVVEQLQEILEDFAEISKATVDSEQDESAEESLVELTEFVRVSVQIVYETLLNVKSVRPSLH